MGAVFIVLISFYMVFLAKFGFNEKKLAKDFKAKCL